MRLNSTFKTAITSTTPSFAIEGSSLLGPRACVLPTKRANFAFKSASANHRDLVLSYRSRSLRVHWLAPPALGMRQQSSIPISMCSKVHHVTIEGASMRKQTQD